jgi:hypothetical protein
MQSPGKNTISFELANFIMQLCNNEYKRASNKKITKQWNIGSSPNKFKPTKQPKIKTNKMNNLLRKRRKTQAVKKPNHITKRRTLQQ